MNHLKQNIIIFTVFCITQAFLNASEKPIIEGIIRTQATITYSSSSYEKAVLIPAGFGTTHFSIPYISVEVVFKEEGLYKHQNQWTQKEPEVIRDYEQEIQCDKSFRAELRTFPPRIPISLLLTHKEGDIFSLTIHGYTAHLICSGMYIQNLSHYNKEHAIQSLAQLNSFNFEQLIDFRLSQFSPAFMAYRNTEINKQEALEKGLVTISPDDIWGHGTNSAHTKDAIITRMIVQKSLQTSCIPVIVLVYLVGKEQ